MVSIPEAKKKKPTTPTCYVHNMVGEIKILGLNLMSFLLRKRKDPISICTWILFY